MKKFGMSEAEKQFLSEYDINEYDRPSVTTDIAAFSVYTEKEDCYRRNPEHKLSVLLVKRGEHPFLNSWALPGGFLKADETIEECALREITEETGVIPVSLMPVGVFSEPDRDPRGRIISNAYTSVISEEQVVKGGSDAADASWFDVAFVSVGRGTYSLSLKCGNTELTSVLKEKRNKFGRPFFETEENNGLAFDHAKIIATALMVLRSEAEKFEVVFDFLPEKFTLNSLQRVQETLLGISLLTPNFRRKIADYVEETDEYTEGAGHRPARLFSKKQK